jgi:hypothetical protein
MGAVLNSVISPHVKETSRAFMTEIGFCGMAWGALFTVHCFQQQLVVTTVTLLETPLFFL